MDKTVINVENLSKRYRIGLKESQANTIAGRFFNIIKSPWQNLKGIRQLSRFGLEDDSIFWALKDINFEVMKGDVLGIIGKNGAGKSTLLKILSHIAEPTFGRVEIHGRVASLLEVGTGFHPELSGRENVYMNGTILGMTRREIDSKFDQIVDFSGVEKFIDTPVKFYSSGMKVRLGFSVAAHLDPEILIIDEVLAVGDFEFQKKCLGKMEDVSRNQGRTVLFVSHNLEAVSTICNRGIVLSGGSVVFEGSALDAISNYKNFNSSLNLSYCDEFNSSPAFVKSVSIITSTRTNFHVFGFELKIEFVVVSTQRIPGATLAFQLIDEKGKAVVHCWVYQSDVQGFCENAGEFKIVCVIPKLRAYMGKYHLTVHFGEGKGGRKYQTLENICGFEVNMFGIENLRGWNPDSCAYIEDFTWKMT